VYSTTSVSTREEAVRSTRVRKASGLVRVEARKLKRGIRQSGTGMQHLEHLCAAGDGGQRQPRQQSREALRCTKSIARVNCTIRSRILHMDHQPTDLTTARQPPIPQLLSACKLPAPSRLRGSPAPPLLAFFSQVMKRERSDLDLGRVQNASTFAG
jgi:hypothetical protein